MLISQVAEQAGVHPSTIRRLEEKGVIEVKRDHNGWRVYDKSAVETLRELYKRPVMNAL